MFFTDENEENRRKEGDEMASKIENVAAYIRVSSEEQKLHGISLDAQRMKLSDYAAANNMKIVEWYEDEGVSGRKLIKNRPELQRMIIDAENRKFERIIFIKLDRFFRSVAEYHECMKRIKPVVWTATEEGYDLTTANGRMLVNMKLTIAELEADQTGERIRIVNDYKVKTGQPLSGSVPFCFIIKKVDGKKRIVKNPDAIPIMEDLFRHLRQYQCKRQATFYINQKYGMEITQQRLKALIENPLLHGEYRGNPNFLLPEDRFLTKEQHTALNALLKRQVKDNTAHRSYIFAGLIKCPKCGRTLSGNARKRSRQKGIVEERLYRCPKKWTYGCCDFGKNISENTIERLMIDNIHKFIDAEAQPTELKCKDGENSKEKIAAMNSELNRLNYAWQKGRISEEKYDAEYDKISKMIEDAKQQQFKYSIETERINHIRDAVKGDWLSIYSNLDNLHKQQFWRSFVESIEVKWEDDIKEITSIKFF